MDEPPDDDPVAGERDGGTDPGTGAGAGRPTGADRRGVKATYDRIADHFAGTRTHPWPEVGEFVESVATGGGLGLDVGCGNGRHAAVLADRCQRVVGVDASRRILAAAARDLSARRWDTDPGAVELVQGDATNLPVVTGAVDLATYVATLHHLPTREARIRSLDELARVLASGGHAIVSAWSTAHDRFDREVGFDTTIDWTLPGGETVPRFYHVYDPDEFDRDLWDSGLVVADTRVSSGNCYARVRGP